MLVEEAWGSAVVPVLPRSGEAWLGQHHDPHRASPLRDFSSLQRFPTLSSVSLPRQLLEVNREGIAHLHCADEESEAQQATIIHQSLCCNLKLV